MRECFRIKRQPERVAPHLGAISIWLLEGDPALPPTIEEFNKRPKRVERRCYRGWMLAIAE